MRARTHFAFFHLAILAGCSLNWVEHPSGLRPDDSTSPVPDPAPEISAGPPSPLSTISWAKRPSSPWNDRAEGFRWRSLHTDEQFEPASVAHSQLHHFLKASDSVVARNAAILLAQRGDDRGREKLEDLIRDCATNTSLSTRAAAAEAMGHLAAPDSSQGLRALYLELGNGDEVVRAELLRSLARHVSPATEPLLQSALKDSHGVVRRAAVEAWRDPRQGPLPASVLRLSHDSDPKVRSAVVELIGVRRDAGSQVVVEAALRDRNRTVRATAAAALGRLGTQQAKDLLKQRARDGQELDRADAVRGLAQSGETKPVYRAARDPSWRVRQAAASALAGFPDPRTVAVFRELITDRSIQVQTAAVDALADWPDRMAVPLLLRFLGEGGFRARTKAHAQLERRWGEKLAAPKTASPSAWGEFASRLRHQWKTTHGLMNTERLGAGRRLASSVESELEPEVVALLDQLQSRDPRAVSLAAKRLASLGPAVLPALHRWAEGRPRPLPKALVAQVLPQLSPLYAAVGRLAHEEVAQRQKAAVAVARLVEQQVLPMPAAEMMVRRMTVESDPYVWQQLLKALELDHASLAQQAARVGLDHPRMLVRRRSCELLVRRPCIDQVEWLEPLLRDENPAIRQAAAEALGASGNPAAAQALSRLLTTPSKPLRVTVAKALNRIGDQKGRDELVRLAYDLDSDVRRDAASAMGEAGKSAFVPTLIALLDDRQLNVRRAALRSLDSIAGEQVRTETASGGATRREQIDAWKQWWQEQVRGRGSN